MTKDAKRVEKIALTLKPEEWQYHGTKKKVTQKNERWRVYTRIVDDAAFPTDPALKPGPDVHSTLPR